MKCCETSWLQGHVAFVAPVLCSTGAFVSITTTFGSFHDQIVYPIMLYLEDVLPNTALPWRRFAQHFPTLDTFCPTMPYIGDVLPNTPLPWRRSSRHCPTLEIFCPTLPYFGDVMPNTALPWIRSAQHSPTS